MQPEGAIAPFFLIPKALAYLLLPIPWKGKVMMTQKKMHWEKQVLILVLAGLIILGLGSAVQPVASQAILETPSDEEAIHNLLSEYFEMRYAIFKPGFLHPQPASLARFVAGSPRAQAFLAAEQDKLEIQQAHAQKMGLTYAEYSFDLEYLSIERDEVTDLVTVELLESSEIVYSLNASEEEPVVTRSGNLLHTLVLVESQTGWQILSDTYEDYLWRMLNASEESKQDWMKSISLLEPEEELPPETGGQGPNCDLPADSTTHMYDRQAAVAYARQYALSYNPAYRDFSGVDCTNYVSQAIYAGNADHACNLASDGLCSGTAGWYYVTGTRYAHAWTVVPSLYNFITNPAVQAQWSTGPEGCETTHAAAMLGDLMQFDWGYDGRYDHTVIITRISYDSSGRKLIYVSSHDQDKLDVPSSYFTYSNPATRYIHIARMDGPNLHEDHNLEPSLYLPAISR